jgi:hypothetical protein
MPGNKDGAAHDHWRRFPGLDPGKTVIWERETPQTPETTALVELQKLAEQAQELAGA